MKTKNEIFSVKFTQLWEYKTDFAEIFQEVVSWDVVAVGKVAALLTYLPQRKIIKGIVYLTTPHRHPVQYRVHQQNVLRTLFFYFFSYAWNLIPPVQ